MTEIVLKYGVPREFMCRLPGDTKCISYSGPMTVVVCEEIFIVGFCLLLHSFIGHLLGRYGLVPIQLHLNAWRAIVNFVAKYIEVRLEPKMRAFKSILFLQVDTIYKLVVYTSYRSIVLASLVFELLHK